MSGLTVDPHSLTNRAGHGPKVRALAGEWAAASVRVEAVGHRHAAASLAAAQFGEACTAGLAASVGLAETLDRLVTGAGHRYAVTDGDAVPTGR